MPSGEIWGGLPETRAGRVRSEGKFFSVEMMGFWGDPADNAHPGRVAWLPTQTQRAVRLRLPSSHPCTHSGGLTYGQRDFQIRIHILPHSYLYLLTHWVSSTLAPLGEMSKRRTTQIPPPVCIVVLFFLFLLMLAHLQKYVCVGRNRAHSLQGSLSLVAAQIPL